MIGKTIAVICFCLLWVCTSALAQPTTQPIVESVLARGQGDQFWILKTEIDADKSVSTSVRVQTDPVAGTWTETNRLAGRIVDAAPLGDRLAVLPAGDAWRILWPGGSLAGPTPPGGRMLRRLASDGETLWAISANGKSQADILTWTEQNGWKVIAPLPPEAVADTASVCIFEQTPWLAWVDHHTAYVARWTGKSGWEKSVRTWTGVGQAAFIPGMPTPLIAGRTYINQKSPPFMTFVRMGIPTDAKGISPKAIRVSDAASIVLVGSSLRAVDIQAGQIIQTVVDNYGRGQSFGPSPIPDPARPQPPTSSEWANVALMTILTVFMLRALRSDSAGMPAVAEGLRVAPLWRRISAGVIDALPLLLAAGWVGWHFKGTVEEFQTAAEGMTLPFAFGVPLYLGLIIYVGHVMASEVIWGRSLGKRLFGLRVVTIDGEPAPAGKIVLRNLLRVVEVALFLPLVFPLFTPTRQRLGDLAAGTVVVKTVLSPRTPQDSASA